MAQAIRYRPVIGGILLCALLATPAIAVEDEYQTHADYSGQAIAIERQLPDNPKHIARKIQEAWVLLSYVVTADGRAIDPIIVDASGGVNFENEVRKVIDTWQFEETQTGAELPFNFVETRFTIRGKGKGTTRKFARYSRHIMKNLQSGNIETSRKHADEAVRIGGWNLYESTILWLMLGRIEGAEGDDAGQLEMYLRALETGDKRSLQHDARIDLLEKIFKLQANFGQYAAAMRSYATLEAVPGSHLAEKRLAARVQEVESILNGKEIVVAKATVSAPCDCEEGSPLWDYVPQRRAFSFANLSGNVGGFEARCESQRISADVVTDKTWTLPAEWGACQVFVFGDDGATFDFLGHANAGAGTSSEEAVAGNHVLDNRSQSQ